MKIRCWTLAVIALFFLAFDLTFAILAGRHPQARP